jgi:hypothetical protein
MKEASRTGARSLLLLRIELEHLWRQLAAHDYP